MANWFNRLKSGAQKAGEWSKAAADKAKEMKANADARTEERRIAQEKAAEEAENERLRQALLPYHSHPFEFSDLFDDDQEEATAIIERFKQDNCVVEGSFYVSAPHDANGGRWYVISTSINLKNLSDQSSRLLFLCHTLKYHFQLKYLKTKKRQEIRDIEDSRDAKLACLSAGFQATHVHRENRMEDFVYQRMEINKSAYESKCNEIFTNGINSNQKEWIELVNDMANGSNYQNLAVQIAAVSIRHAIKHVHQADIQDHQIENMPHSLILGETNGTPVYFNGERSLVTIAPPESGKTQCNVLPNLRRYPGPCIVLDVKGECYEETAADRSEYGPVLRFDPSDPSNSHSFNPLQFISTDLEEVWDDALLLAEMIVVPSGAGDNAAWENQGREFLALCICAVVLVQQTIDPHTPAKMTEILQLAYNVGTQEMLNEVTDNELEDQFPLSMRMVAMKYKEMRNNAPKQFEGVLSGCTQHLSAWASERVNKVVQQSDWSVVHFRADQPATLYICIPPDRIQQYRSVLRVIIGQHVHQLMKAGERFDKHTQLPVLFMLDEFPQLGKMEHIQKALDVGRSYGIKLWMICQYQGQMRDTYGPEAAKGMIGVCGAEIFMNPSFDDAEWLSNRLGTVDSPFKDREEPLMTPQQLMAPDFRNKQLVFIDGQNPMQVDKVFDYQR